MDTGCIIVGVDDSETAFRAAEVAAGLADALKVPLHVVTAYDLEQTERVGVGTDTVIVSSYSLARQLVEGVASRLRLVHPDITTAAGEGAPHEVLIAEARRLGARTIVVGNRRMQGIGRLLGSVANDVTHHAPCDVYVVKTS